MSTCNCDGTINVSITEKIFGDSVLSSLGINESQFNPLAGGTDPRPLACQQAVGTLKASGQDPCDLDSPGDLDVLYQQFLPSVWATIQGTPTTNTIQKAADTAAGTAIGTTPVVNNTPKPSTNYAFIVGAILILAVGFILVFK